MTGRQRFLARLARTIAGLELGRPVRVGIDGVDASGKTTLADELGERLESLGRPVIRASVDRFHRPRAERYRRGELSAEGCYLDSYDYQALRATLLAPLGPGGTRRYRTRVFDSRRNEPIHEPERVAAESSVLLLDGVFLLRPETAPYLDFTVYLVISEETALRRALARDRSLLGSEASVRERYERRYLPAQRLYRALTRPDQFADVVVDNSDFANPRVVTPRGEETSVA